MLRIIRNLLLGAALMGGCSSPAPLEWNLGDNNPANPDAKATPYESGEDALLRTGSEMPEQASASEMGSHDMPMEKDMPTENCIVSGAKLGSMGEPVVIKHGGQELRFCCQTCVAKFKANPSKYLDAMAEAQQRSLK